MIQPFAGNGRHGRRTEDNLDASVRTRLKIDRPQTRRSPERVDMGGCAIAGRQARKSCRSPFGRLSRHAVLAFANDVCRPKGKREEERGTRNGHGHGHGHGIDTGTGMGMAFYTGKTDHAEPCVGCCGL